MHKQLAHRDGQACRERIGEKGCAEATWGQSALLEGDIAVIGEEEEEGIHRGEPNEAVRHILVDERQQHIAQHPKAIVTESKMRGKRGNSDTHI